MLTNAPANTHASRLRFDLGLSSTVHAVLKAVESWSIRSAAESGNSRDYRLALLNLARAAADVARFQ